MRVFFIFLKKCNKSKKAPIFRPVFPIFFYLSFLKNYHQLHKHCKYVFIALITQTLRNEIVNKPKFQKGKNIAGMFVTAG